ncbi:ankyrin repeat domain-containing protein [Stenotrophomonas rhizophila]|jgi:hypothetical protein|uniref:ankyrin repeat domain-containing protein n=1 Tax=Stenotrophomonas rhizophila TaxID=216778 RepID=UPI00201CE878|nr:ankyrin repeat domain-containing protein [Stenotrophomonas rhizophila]UQY86915.1 ankyrin repeat domain-containing protein [Stenotrophomonas rhizophila]
MDRISTHTAVRARPTLSGLAVGLAQLGRQMSPAMRQIRDVCNPPAPTRTRGVPLPNRSIQIEQVTDATQIGELEQLSGSEIDGMRCALTLLKQEHATLHDALARAQCRSQIERIEQALAGQTDQVRSELPEAAAVAIPPAAVAATPDARARGTTASAFSGLRNTLARAMAAPPSGLVRPHDTALAPANTGAGPGRAVTTYALPSFELPGHRTSGDTALSTLVNTLGVWCSSHVEAFSSGLKRNAEQRMEIAATPRPAPYTALEMRCHVDTRTSARDYLFKPSSVAVIKKLVMGNTHDGNPNAGAYGAVHLAVMANKPERLKALLDAAAGKIDLDRISPHYGDTALGLALRHSHERCAELLIEAGASVKTTDFKWLVVNGQTDMFLRLHAHWKAQVTLAADMGTAVQAVDFHSVLATAVHWDRVDLATYLLESGLRLDPANNDLLQLAAARGHAAMVWLLLRHAPAGSVRLHEGPSPERSPLALAMREAHLETVAALLSAGPDPAWVAAATDHLSAAVAVFSPYEREKFAPLLRLLRGWLQPQRQSQPLPQITAALPVGPAQVADAANDPSPSTGRTARHSRRVLAPSLAFPPARAL